MKVLTMEGIRTLKEEGGPTVQGLKYSFCNGEDKRQLPQECSGTGGGRSCAEGEDSPILVKQTRRSQNIRGFPSLGPSSTACEGVDSPVSVIFAASKHLMQLSHPSSACTSMEHPLHHLDIVSQYDPALFRYHDSRSLPPHDAPTANYTASMGERVQQAFSKSHESMAWTAKARECNLESENKKKALHEPYHAKVMKPWPHYSIRGKLEWLNLQEDPPLITTPGGIHSKECGYEHISRTLAASSPDEEEAESSFSVCSSTRDQDEESVIDFFPPAKRTSSASQLRRRSYDRVLNEQLEKGSYGEKEDVKRVSCKSRSRGMRKMNGRGGGHDGVTAPEEAREQGTMRLGCGKVHNSGIRSKWDDAERWLSCTKSSGGLPPPPPPPPLLTSNDLHLTTLLKADIKHVSENSTTREAGTVLVLESMRDMATQSTPIDWSRCESPEVPSSSIADEKAILFAACPKKGVSALKVSPPRHNTPARRSASCSKDSATKPCALPSGGKLNLLELENCHLDKLKLARDLPLGTSTTWQLYPDEDIDQSPKSLDHKTPLYENAKNQQQEAKVNMLEVRVSAWEDVERAKHIAKFKREEAKIESWERLQRAEADAEFRKLEVKLEKLRFEGREKIMARLVSAQRRAHEMLSAAETHKVEQLARVGTRANHIRKSGHLPSSTFNVVCSLTTKIKPTSSFSFA